MVKKSFKALEDQLAEERGLKTIYGGGLPDCPRTKLRGEGREIDAMKMLLRDPMSKLKAYVEKEGYRMLDLLKSFDRDNSFTISLEELKEGIRVKTRKLYFNGKKNIKTKTRKIRVDIYIHTNQTHNM